MRTGLRRLMVCLAVAVVVTACGGNPPAKTTARAPQAARIAVVSMLGPQAKLMYVGTTIFNNASADAPAGHWALDAAVQRAAGAALHTRGWQAVSPAGTQRPALGEFKLALFGSGFDPDTGAIQAYARSVGASRVLVVGPLLHGDPFFGTTETFPGYGVGQRTMFGMRTAVNYLRLDVVLFDGTGRKLTDTHITEQSDRPDTLWIENEDLALRRENETATRAAVLALVPKAVNRAIAKLDGKL